MATISYRKNIIAQIQDDYGVSLIHHEEKANHLWCVLKDRMGKSSNACMEFDMGSLVHGEVELTESRPLVCFAQRCAGENLQL